MTPYERLREQQQIPAEDIAGHAVVTASDRTVRAAYMTGNGCELTNDERQAFVGSKEEATALMVRLYESSNWYDNLLWKIAFLVPSSKTKESCIYNGLPTYQGH